MPRCGSDHLCALSISISGCSLRCALGVRSSQAARLEVRDLNLTGW
jgi:hypothetical protein